MTKRSPDDLDNHLLCAEAILSVTMEAMHAPCGNKEYEYALFAVLHHVEQARSILEDLHFPGNKKLRK